MTAPLYGYGAVFALLSGMQVAVVSEAQSQGIQFPRISIVPGAIAWDDCSGYCGLFALSSGRMYPTDNFPIEVATTEQAHGGMTAVELTVQTIRCAPEPQGKALSPTVQALSAAAQTVLDDQWVVYCAITQYLETMFITNQISAYMIRQSSVVGPEGGCVGSELACVVGLLPR